MRRIFICLPAFVLLLGVLTAILSPVPAATLAIDPNNICSGLAISIPDYTIANKSADSGWTRWCQGDVVKVSTNTKVGRASLHRYGSADEARQEIQWSVSNDKSTTIGGYGEWAVEKPVIPSFRAYLIYFFRGSYVARVSEMDDVKLNGQATSLGRAIAKELDQRLGVPAPAPTAPPPPPPPSGPACSPPPPIDCSLSSGDLKVTAQDMQKIACDLWKKGGALPDINQQVINQILALAKQRGGSGTVKCGYDATQAATPTPTPKPTATASDAAKCFYNGLARITMAEIDSLIQSDVALGRPYDDIVADVQLANEARGGSGMFICRPVIPQAPEAPGNPESAKDPAACFRGGQAQITWEEMVEAISWGRQQARPSADIKADLEALNRSRGGQGALTCDVDAILPPTSGSPTAAESCQTLMAAEQAAKDEIKAQLADLEQQMAYWRHLEMMPELRWLAYIAEVNAPSLFDPPISPSQMARIIDRKYGRPSYGDAFVRREGTNQWVNPDVIWLESDAAQQAAAEKKAYEDEYAQRMERVKQARALPTGPENIRQFVEPSRQLDEIAKLQDFLLESYRAHDAKLDEYQQKHDTGYACP